ncbi:MAG: hypothetical protein EBR72_00765 [Bacteroidetes bacterium]|nr:hypothetical protein [Bacteroidota bacterium]
MNKFYALVLASCLSCTIKKEHQIPKLVVLISVDQMRGDYMSRYRSDFNGGLKYLAENSQSFLNTHHNHANTSTAPGHATIATGCHPSNNGITNNSIYYRNTQKSHYSILDTSINFVGITNCTLTKSSAKNLLKPSIGDIVKSYNPKSKSYSVSLKDRASILMGGHDANRAFWFDATSTQMVSTDYYAEPFPDWVKNYLGKEVMADDVAKGWLLHPKIRTTYDLYIDAADYIGHGFGPDSYEVADYYYKLDQYLLEFINYLNKKIGQENYILTLTSDHGVAPFPELTHHHESQGERISQQKFQQDIDSIDATIQRELNLNEPSIIAASGYRGVEPNFKVISNPDIDSVKLVNHIQKHLKNLDYIQETVSFIDINNRSCNKLFIEKMRNSYNPNHGYFIKIIGKKNYLIGYKYNGTTHGSPLCYDTHVPLLFLGTNIQSRQVKDTAYTVDIAPTLLDYIGIEYDRIFDGNKLNLILK